MQGFSDEELVAFYNSLPNGALHASYTALDRARDFRQAFTTESGVRVLSFIVTFCSPFTPSSQADKQGLLAYREGQRSILAMILKAMQNPGPKPDEGVENVPQAE